MVNTLSRTKITAITTSWDDGHPLDMRVAERLACYGMVGTFYVLVDPLKRPVMPREDLQTLRHMGMEIGSHTLMHHELPQLPLDQARAELVDSKARLEDILGEEVTSLCYPKGKFNRRVRALAAAAGYTVARTTLAFHTALEVDPLCMPVSLQMFPHSSRVHFQHALKEGNLRGLLQWYRHWHMEPDPINLSSLIIEHVQEHGGIYHLWGHSWEIEQWGLWPMFEAILKHLSHRHQALYLTNAQVWQHSDPSKS